MEPPSAFNSVEFPPCTRKTWARAPAANNNVSSISPHWIFRLMRNVSGSLRLALWGFLRRCGHGRGVRCRDRLFGFSALQFLLHLEFLELQRDLHRNVF